MTTNYRALCAEMLSGWRTGKDIAGPMNRAAAALKAEPEGEVPMPDHVNLIAFAFGREPWATWLRKGGCLESAHCELSDLMLAAITRWGTPAAAPVPEEPEGEGMREEQWDALLELAWDKYETIGYQGERFMWDSDFDSALDFIRQEIARHGQKLAPPIDPEGGVSITQSISIVRYEFEVLDEHDQTVASGDASTLEEVAREGRHYLSEYQQDGPCTLELRRVEVLNSDATPPAPEPSSEALAAPVAWCRSDDFLAALLKRQSFSGWRKKRPDCDMALYAQASAAPDADQSEEPSLGEAPSDEQIANLAEEFCGDPLPTVRRALDLWGAPATPPAPQAGEVQP